MFSVINNFLELIWDFSKNPLHDNVFFTAVHDSCLDITRTQSFNENDKSSEEWISYLNLMHKYLPISIKKRIYTKTISTQTLLTETQTNLYNNIKNIKLLKKNIIEKTYV